jgi:hypothetical protein
MGIVVEDFQVFGVGGGKDTVERVASGLRGGTGTGIFGVGGGLDVSGGSFF